MTKKQLAEKKAVQHILDKQKDVVIDEVFNDKTSFEETVIAEEVIKETVKPLQVSTKEMNKNIDFEGRGFATMEDAYNFVNTAYFKGLGQTDQDEYKNWLKK